MIVPPLQQNLQKVKEKHNNITKPYQNGVLTKKESSVEKKIRNLFKHLYKISLNEIFGFSPRISDLSI